MPFTADTQRAWVDVDLDALVRNARTYQDVLGVPLLPMVKANAYGLGALPVARALAAIQPTGWGVATTTEALELRQGGVEAPIIVFTPLDATQLADHRAIAARPVIGDVAALAAWLAASDDPFHLEIDTGMARTGFRFDDHAALHQAAQLVGDRRGWEGIYTHFHSSRSDDRATALQWQRLHAALAILGQHPPMVHAASSNGARFGATYAGTLARPGLLLYGGEVPGIPVEPVAALRARVVALRQLNPGDTVGYDAAWSAPRSTRIATIAVGYADGVLRSLSSRGMVELHGELVPMVGSVTMDFVMVDVGTLPVAIGDVATLFGGKVSLDAQAACAGTIAYELLTSLGPRLPRRYRWNR